MEVGMHARHLAFGLGSFALATLLVTGATDQVTAPNAKTISSRSMAITPLLNVGPVIKAFKTSAPPSSQTCMTLYGIACYGPADMANEYNFTQAYAAGYKGQGQTIVIFDSYGSPTIRQDLQTFDSAYNLPPPPAFNIFKPEGNVQLNYKGLTSPANFNNKYVDNQIGWAYETTLDVEYAHAMAPAATIDLVVIPASENNGVTGLSNMENAQKWSMNMHLGNIWSNSWATAEETFGGSTQLSALNSLYQSASANGISAFFASGDSGVQNFNAKFVPYTYRTVNFPSSSPNVISVGGTEIPSTPSSITSHVTESAWNDGYGAGGGGYSVVFHEPQFQSSANITDPTAMRGLPDVSYNAAVLSAVNIYESFDPIYGPGWVPIGGTSAATPQWAATDAVIQSADGSQGYIAPKLYKIYTNPAQYSTAFYDVTSGNNSFGGVTGYNAAPGWDAATGLGTPNVYGLIQALKTS